MIVGYVLVDRDKNWEWGERFVDGMYTNVWIKYIGVPDLTEHHRQLRMRMAITQMNFAFMSSLG